MTSCRVANLSNTPCGWYSSVTNRQQRIRGAATAALPDELRELSVAVDTGLLVCPECQRAFKGKRGLAQHRRGKHPEEYHLENVPQPRKKARWDQEELFILAKTELALRRSGVKFINQALLEVTPGRTLEAIKGTRKSRKYQELLDSLQQESDSGEPPEIERNLERERPVFGLGENEDIPNSDPPPADTNDGWAEILRNAIQELGVPNGIDLDAITPDQPSAVTRSVLDTEYARWLPPIAKKPRNPPRRPARLANTSPRAKRRANYARVQRSFKSNRSRCARDVLSGSWEVEPSPVPMAEQEPYWRGIFECPSMEDTREPQPKGPIVWSLMAPITISDVTSAIKGMSEGAPGPDGRTLADLKAVRREELAAHFNVWLLAGYPPSALRRGETVLIEKEPGTRTPAKHRPITISDITIRCFHKILAWQLATSLPWNARQKAFWLAMV